MPSQPSTSPKIDSLAAQRTRQRMFSDAQDATVENEQAWMSFLDGVQAKDVTAIAEGLRCATGRLTVRSASGRRRSGRLPQRAANLIDGGQPFADTALGFTVPMTALDLLVHAVPEVLAKVIEQDAQAHPDRALLSSLWIGSSGDLTDALKTGSPEGRGRGNRHWPAIVVAMVSSILDHVGDRLLKWGMMARWTAEPHGFPYEGMLRWLQETLKKTIERPHAPQMLEDENGEPLGFTIARGAQTVERTLMRTTIEHLKREHGQDLAVWEGWVRRWMVVAERADRPTLFRDIPFAFWQQFPNALLPLRLDDAISPHSMLMAHADVFTEARLIPWLLAAPGSSERRSEPSLGWFWIEHRSNERQIRQNEPWTWLEWATYYKRTNVAVALVERGARLTHEFGDTVAPDDLQRTGKDRLYIERRYPWVGRRDALRRVIDHVTLRQTLLDMPPQETASRLRSRL